MPPCKHIEICGLENDPHSSPQYCILHLPSKSKEAYRFTSVLNDHLNKGRSDFRHVTFPENVKANFTGRHFTSRVDFTDAIFYGGLSLAKAVMPHGLTLKTTSLSAIDMADTTISGPVSLTLEQQDVAQISLPNAKITGPLSISARNAQSISITDAQVSETIDIRLQDLTIAEFMESKIAKGITIRGRNIREIHFSSDTSTGLGAVVVGKTEIVFEKGSLIHLNTTFTEDVIIAVRELKDLNLDRSTLLGELSFSGAVAQCSINLAIVEKGVRFDNCTIRQPIVLDQTAFSSTAELHFNGSTYEGNLSLDESRSPPKIISLNGTRINGELTVQSELGKPFIQVLANRVRPRVTKKISFTNVDLSECLLLGNPIRTLEISNVKWARRCGRNVLFDEVVMRDKKSAPWGNLKEAYQILKENYSKVGDHATSGDFHYGEMEAKRREYGWLKRRACPEFPYWLCSGYGIGYVRAFIWLVILIFGFAMIYFFWGGETLQSDLGKSILFSVQSAFLLRPTRPAAFPITAEWAQTIESMIVPVMTALFVLALRMRLKR